MYTTIDAAFLSLLDQLQGTHPGSEDRTWSTRAHNAAIGGAAESGHIFDPSIGLLCCAADLKYDTMAQLYAATQRARSLGFLGVELDLSNNHLHVDMKTRDAVWHVVHHGPGNEEPLDAWLAAQASTV